MLARRLLCKKQLRNFSCNHTVVRHAQSVSQPKDTFNLDVRLPALIKKEQQRQPFAKNLFLGMFDHEFIYFPESQTKERHQQFYEWLKPIEKYISDSLADPQNIKKENVIAHLRELGVFRANVDEQYVGLGLLQTELAKLIEVLSCFPWLSSYMVKNHIEPTHIISTLASDKQKAEYLPKIASGNIVPTVCFTESGFNIHNIDTNALLSDCETYWILNGKKSFVFNGHNSDLFLVFASCGSNFASSSKHKVLSIFLVERDFNGITYKNTDLVGKQDNYVCTVTFKDTKIPRENIIGEIGCGLDILVDSLAPGNRYIAPQTVGILKVFIKLLTTHVLQRKHLDKNLHEYEAIQEVIGKIATVLHSMESMLYMTTGMIDRFENQDCTLEKVMVEAYCAKECVASIYEGLQVIGAQCYLRENPYIQILEDVLSYTLFDSYNIDSTTYVSLLGLQHAGKNLHKHIFKLRNPFAFPQQFLKYVFGKENQLKLHIADHIHPSLISGSEILEECISKLASMVVLLLSRHSSEISDRQMELRRLSEMAIRTFALISVLSRVSRSYCIGLRNSEQERHLAGNFAINTLYRVQVLTNEITMEDWNNGDRLHKDIATLMYKHKDYFAEHPLNRTY